MLSSVAKYNIFCGFSDLVTQIVDIYSCDIDEKGIILLKYFEYLGPLHEKYNNTVDLIVSFCNDNKESLQNGEIQRLTNEKFIFDDQAEINIQYFLNKNDDNSSIIFDHLNNILRLVDGGLSAEEVYLTEMMSHFKELIVSQVQDQNVTTQDQESIIESIGNSIQPELEEKLEQFETQKLDINRFVKLVCLKLKDYLEVNNIPSEILQQNRVIHKSEILSILDMVLEHNLDDIMDRKFEILAKLSSSGILANIPLPYMMQLVGKCSN